MSTKAQPIEPVLLFIFRLFVSLRVVYSVALIVISIAVVQVRLNYGLLLGLLVFSFTLLYLSSGWLQQHMGRFYLPTALVIVTLMLILERAIINWRLALQWEVSPGTPVQMLLSGIVGVEPRSISLDSSWPPMLFVPLVLAAWQYNFRSVIIFTVATTTLYIVLYAAPFRGLDMGMVEFGVGLTGRMIALGIVGYAVASLASALKEQRNTLRETNTQLVNHLTVQEQLATSQERNRLARELHDTLAHSLSATTIQLEASTALWESNPAKARDLLQRALVTTRAGLLETRRALEALRASPLEDLGLLLSLRQLANESAERSGYQLELKLPASLEALPPQMEQTIYRCTQEILSNIARHAAAQYVCFQLKAQNGLVELTISDDGRGFNLDKIDRSKSFGLTGVRERLEMLGGRLEVISQPGHGTTIDLLIGTTS
jgi:signal transduction histidine kinase